jgi:post-segregation antitoxin (ccd killing protein)
MAETLDLAINPKLLAEARDLGLDVTYEVEAALSRRIEKRKRELVWQRDNRAAIDAWNREVEENGLWYERLR